MQLTSARAEPVAARRRRLLGPVLRILGPGLIVMALGAFEISFLVAAVLAHPRPGALVSAMWSHQPLGNHSYLALIAANVGAVVMPWMVFYQQGAVVDKGLQPRQIRIGRLDTALGAVVTQAIMAAVLIVTGATLAAHGGSPLRSIGAIAGALTPYLGATASHLTLGLGITGASLLAGIVVSLAASWAVAEAFGARRSLDDRPGRAPMWWSASWSRWPGRRSRPRTACASGSGSRW
jgi:Mn2+/Fe2+ NRAMP family transporter